MSKLIFLFNGPVWAYIMRYNLHNQNPQEVKKKALPLLCLNLNAIYLAPILHPVLHLNKDCDITRNSYSKEKQHNTKQIMCLETPALVRYSLHKYRTRKGHFAGYMICCGYFVAITLFACSTCTRAKYVISARTSRKRKHCLPYTR